MDRPRLFALAAGLVLGAASIGAAVFLPPLLSGVVIQSGGCPKDFEVSVLETTAGYFYAVGLVSERRRLNDYAVVFSVWSSPDPNQTKVVHFDGAMTSLLGGVGNFSFVDGGGQAGVIDGTGDYFWARTYHNLEVLRDGQLVAGTWGCI